MATKIENEPKFRIGQLCKVGEVFLSKSVLKEIRVWKGTEDVDKIMFSEPKIGLGDGLLPTSKIRKESFVLILLRAKKEITVPLMSELVEGVKYRYYYNSLGEDGIKYWISETYLSNT